MPKTLAPDQVRCFAEQGFAFPVPVLSAEEAAGYRGQCDALEAQLGGKPRTVDVRQMHLHFGWAWRLATHQRVLDAAEDLLGPNLLIWATELFAKHPHDPVVSIGWHRDGPYMGLAPERTVTAWIALSDSRRANGCMQVVCEAGRQQKTTRQPAAGEVIEEVSLAAGEMSLHDVFVLHGSGPNLSGQKRVGFAIRFTTPDAPPTADRPPAILARGSDRHGYFHLLQPPREDDTAAALAQMRGSARRHLDATLENLQRCKLAAGCAPADNA